MKTTRTLTTALAAIAITTAPLTACSIFTITGDNLVLVGNNEDWSDTGSTILFMPATDQKHGVVYFLNRGRSAQGGMNDQGLFFDYAATGHLAVTESRGKLQLHPARIMHKVMAECATVDEALALFDKYDLTLMNKHQALICDKNGDSAILEGDDILRKKGPFQVTTNFYQSKLRKPGFFQSVSNIFSSSSHPTTVKCKRFKIATAMLSKMKDPTVEKMRDVLNAVHQEGRYPTQYSNVYDLKNAVIYTYLFHDYTNVVKLDLREELAKGAHSLNLPSLFPSTPRFAAFQTKIEPKLLAALKKKADQKTATANDLNAYAWQLLTCETKTLRDPKIALGWALKAVGKSDQKDAGILDTLGLAYHMTGHTQDAIKTQQKAIALLPPGQSPTRTVLEKNLAMFKAD